MDTLQVCQVMDAVSVLGYQPSAHFLHSVLKHTRIYNLRNTSHTKLAGLARSLERLGLKPSWGFLQVSTLCFFVPDRGPGSSSLECVQ